MSGCVKVIVAAVLFLHCIFATESVCPQGGCASQVQGVTNLLQVHQTLNSGTRRSQAQVASPGAQGASRIVKDDLSLLQSTLSVNQRVNQKADEKPVVYKRCCCTESGGKTQEECDNTVGDTNKKAIWHESRFGYGDIGVCCKIKTQTCDIPWQQPRHRRHCHHPGSLVVSPTPVMMARKKARERGTRWQSAQKQEKDERAAQMQLAREHKLAQDEQAQISGAGRPAQSGSERYMAHQLKNLQWAQEYKGNSGRWESTQEIESQPTNPGLTPSERLMKAQEHEYPGLTPSERMKKALLHEYRALIPMQSNEAVPEAATRSQEESGKGHKGCPRASCGGDPNEACDSSFRVDCSACSFCKELHA